MIFIGVTALTIGSWLAGQNPYTTPVSDLAFFALGGVIISLGLLVQLRQPERCIVGLQQSLLGAIALAVAGLGGARLEPIAGAIVVIVMTVVLVLLHPARSAFFSRAKHMRPALATLALLPVIPAAVYSAQMLASARAAGPSCFLGQCPVGDRYAEMAALAVAIALVGLLAALGSGSGVLPAWSAGTSSALLGLASLALPQSFGALSTLWAWLAVLWGAAFITVAHRGWLQLEERSVHRVSGK